MEENSKEVISLDFIIKEETVSRGVKNSFHMKGNNHEGVWGNRWVIGLDALTIRGERNSIYEFILEQPMISRFSYESYKDLEVKEVEKEGPIKLPISIEKPTYYLEKIKTIPKGDYANVKFNDKELLTLVPSFSYKGN